MTTGPSAGAIRVLLADGDRLFTRRLMRTLSSDARIDVVGCATDGREAVELTTSLLPDLILMGIDTPELDGIEATRRIRETVPSAVVLILGPSERRDDVEHALEAGAAGVVRRDCASIDLTVTIFGLASALALDTPPVRGRPGPRLTDWPPAPRPTSPSS